MVDFNPRSRVGNDKPVRVYDIDNGISIHVPAWGTTFKPDSNAGRWVISIHVPAWGTTVLCGLTGGKVGFQSTFPRGERRDSVTCHPLNIAISIHVPAWGTTILRYCSLNTLEFQSTFPRGERQLYSYFLRYLLQFQSTFPRGERLTPYLSVSKTHRFQSTFPRGERRSLARAPFQCDHQISIHVPAWGTTAMTLLC